MISSRRPGKDTDQSSLRSIASQIRAEKGVQGFWSGYSASLVLTLNPSLTFFFFEALKRTLLSRSQRQTSSPQTTFLLAAISKAMASTITYPFSLAKSRLQSSSGLGKGGTASTVKEEGTYTSSRTPGNVFTVIRRIAKTEGFSALYEGLEGEVMKGFFSHGITMIVKEAVHKLVIRLYYSILKMLKKYPSPQELAGSVTEQAVQVAEDVKDLAGSVTEQSGQMAANISQSAGAAKEQAGRRAENLGQQVKQAVADSKGQVAKRQKMQAVKVAENLVERKQKAVTMAKSAVSVVKEKTQDLAGEASPGLTTDDT